MPMIDIHCHILPGIDDGAADMQVSLGMSKIAADDGVTHIVATPHFTYGEKPTVENIYAGVALLQEGIKKEGIPVQVLCGADIRLTYELISGFEDNSIPTINNSRYFLLELPALIPPNLDDFLFEIKLKGFVPIITHPERNYSLMSSPGKVRSLRGNGCLVQLTAMSITGEFGRRIRGFSETLIEKDLVDFVASDAHGINRRTPVLSRAYKEIDRISGGRVAERLFRKNPEAVIKNLDIMYG